MGTALKFQLYLLKVILPFEISNPTKTRVANSHLFGRYLCQWKGSQRSIERVYYSSSPYSLHTKLQNIFCAYSEVYI